MKTSATSGANKKTIVHKERNKAMRMDIVASSKNDEFYTLDYAIEPILKYIKPESKVWCPFDKEQSHFVKLLKMSGHEVVATHIDDGADFLTTNVECDCIISNPPYSIKTEVLQRLFKIGKPFAMLVGVVGLFESQKRFDMFKGNKFEVMYLSRRVSYFKNYDDEKPSLNPPFSSVYLCHDMLPKQIVFEEIKKT